MCKICNYCKRQSKELVLDVCLDCIDAENVIANGIGANGKSVDKKDGIEYFDDAKFCQYYNLPEAIPNKLILQPASLSLK